MIVARVSRVVSSDMGTNWFRDLPDPNQRREDGVIAGRNGAIHALKVMPGHGLVKPLPIVGGVCIAIAFG
jgi:hypothetical protein